MGLRPLLLAVLTGCAGWGNLPHQSNTDVDRPLWDPTDAVPSQHGLYVTLPHAGGLALLTKDGNEGRATRIDLGEGRLTKLSASPDGATLLGFVEYVLCDVEGDQKEPRYVEDCNEDDRVYRTELSIVRGDRVEDTFALDGAFNAVRWSSDGSYAIAYLDLANLRIDGVIDLTSVVAIDLSGDPQPTPIAVGFAADRVLFVEGAGGRPEKAVVLSQNSVALLDLLPEVPVREVTFPLSLDPDTVVTPVGVELTPDGGHALITVEGRADLYVLDLVSASINLVELSGIPAAMAVNEDLDRTVITYRDTNRVDVLDHDLFELESTTLDESMNRVTMRGDYAVLYDTRGGHDAYKLDLVTHVLTEYRLQNPAVSMHVAPTDEFAIGFTRAEDGFGGGGVSEIYDANPGMEILDLRDDDAQPFLLEGLGVGLAWSPTASALHALVLQDGIDYLYQLDLYTGRSEELELDGPPVAIGTMPDGDFFITHESALGLVTFLDPATGDTVVVSGFGTLGLTDPLELLVDDQAKE